MRLALLFCFVVPTLAVAQTALSPYRAHDLERPRPAVITPGGGPGNTDPPSDAIVLFDGQDLAAWTSGGGAAKWRVENGCLVAAPHSGALRTRQAFGDVQLHIEWSSPSPPVGNSQGRGNSGVYFMTKYEVQVLDSFQNETYADGQAGAIYGQNPPLVNACLPPGEWQSYDIIFHRPRFDEQGELDRPATLTVLHNGVLVQDHFSMWGPSNWLKFDEYQAHADKLPLQLQDHGNPVRFRNIWLRELPDQPDYRGLGEATAQVELSEDQLEPLVGKYENVAIQTNAGQLQMRFHGRVFDLVPVAELHFMMKRTNGAVTFQKSDADGVTGLVFDLTGHKRELNRTPD